MKLSEAVLSGDSVKRYLAEKSDTQGTRGNKCLKWKIVAENYCIWQWGGGGPTNFFAKVQNGLKTIAKI